MNRGTNASDGRGVQLVLSARGRGLYRRLLATAVERNAALLDVLTRAERQALDRMLHKLTKKACELFAEEAVRGNGKVSR
jgi:DNA-binding MarR family transcriptional regulator